LVNQRPNAQFHFKEHYVFPMMVRINFIKSSNTYYLGKIYPLPPSFGPFPICKVDDYLDKVPPEWKKHGGVFIPMYQREAMWIKFNGESPKAVKVAVGKVNAISGKTWNQALQEGVNDYVTIPDQPWLDGINAGNGYVRQFVAMPLGQGYTVEAQVTGKEEFGGIQMIVYESKYRRKPILLKPKLKFPFSNTSPPQKPVIIFPPVYKAPQPPVRVMNQAPELQICHSPFAFKTSAPPAVRSMNVMRKKNVSNTRSTHITQERQQFGSEASEMGIAAGGKMKQKIYKDPYGIDFWDQTKFGRVFVHIVNSAMYKEITGKEPPPTPIDAKTYSEYGYAWYDIYDEQKSRISKSDVLSNIKTVKEIDAQKYAWPQQDDTTVPINGNQVITYYKNDKDVVRDGDW